MGTSDKPTSTPDARILQRAVEAYGSLHHLAEALDVSVHDLKRWLSGEELAPHDVFMKALELAFARKRPTKRKPPRKSPRR